MAPGACTAHFTSPSLRPAAEAGAVEPATVLHPNKRPRRLPRSPALGPSGASDGRGTGTGGCRSVLVVVVGVVGEDGFVGSGFSVQGIEDL